MSAAAHTISGIFSVNEDNYQVISAPVVVPAVIPLIPFPLQLRQGSLAPQLETSLCQMGSLGASNVIQEPEAGQAATDTTASERSSSATTAAEGPAAATDASKSPCSDPAFIPTDRDYDFSRVPLAFHLSNGVEIPAAHRAAGRPPVTSRPALEVDVLTAQMNQLGMHGCQAQTDVGKSAGPTTTHLQDEQLSLYGQIQPHEQHNEDRNVLARKSNWPAYKNKDNTALGLFHGPAGQRRLHEGPRNRRRSCPSSPAAVCKARAGDTSDQVYRLGLLLRQLGRLGKVRSCWEIWQEMVNTEGLKPNAVSYGCILDALVSNGALDMALKLLAEMKASHQAIRPNTVMYSTLIKGCAQGKQLDQALALFEEMAAQGVEVNTVTYNSLLDVCARVGAMDRAAMLLDDMLKKGIKPDLITFSTIIKGYCAHGQMDKGLVLLKAMKQKNINPDGVLYNSLLDGCVRAGRSALCLELWQEMQAQRIKPSNFTLSILIKLHGRMRQLQVAFELVKQLPKMYDFKLNAHVYTCLMAACIENRQYRAAYNVLQNMRREGVAADSKTVSTIVFGCLKGRMHAQAVEVVLNALESLREMNSRCQSRQVQRARQGAGFSGRKQNLPAIDEKTVRFLAYHLRDQHMHQECTLVLDTAVSVGLMTRSAAESLLSGEGSDERRYPPVSSRTPAGMMALPHPAGRQTHRSGKAPPMGARLTELRGGHQQGSSRWHEAGSGLRHPVRSREAPRRSGHGGAKEGYVPPAVAQAEGYLTFYGSAPFHPDEHGGSSHERWFEPQGQLYPATSEQQAPYQLQQGMDCQRTLAAQPVEQFHLQRTGVPREIPVQHLQSQTTSGSSYGASGGGPAPILCGRTTSSCRSTTRGMSPYCAEERIAIPGSTLHAGTAASASLDLYAPEEARKAGQAWTSSAPGLPPAPIDCGVLSMPPTLPRPAPQSVELFSDTSALLEAGASFGREDNCRLPGLPLSLPAYSCEPAIRPPCTTAPLFQ